mmetsp:Transcript_32274/g.101666  ORF Transcript_32274/g.101666 Transcript_32274/m.101666 type:complete len:303 (+) Transcript_32274:249-1157(+)
MVSFDSRPATRSVTGLSCKMSSSISTLATASRRRSARWLIVPDPVLAKLRHSEHGDDVARSLWHPSARTTGTPHSREHSYVSVITSDDEPHERAPAECASPRYRSPSRAPRHAITTSAPPSGGVATSAPPGGGVATSAAARCGASACNAARAPAAGGVASAVADAEARSSTDTSVPASFLSFCVTSTAGIGSMPIASHLRLWSRPPQCCPNRMVSKRVPVPLTTTRQTAQYKWRADLPLCSASSATVEAKRSSPSTAVKVRILSAAALCTCPLLEVSCSMKAASLSGLLPEMRVSQQTQIIS